MCPQGSLYAWWQAFNAQADYTPNKQKNTCTCSKRHHEPHIQAGLAQAVEQRATEWRPIPDLGISVSPAAGSGARPGARKEAWGLGRAL
jgi:hypothetical protein